MTDHSFQNVDITLGLGKRAAAKRLKVYGYNTNPFLLHQDPSHSAWPILSLTAHTLASGLISMVIYVALSIIGGLWWQVGAMAALLAFFLLVAWFHTIRWRSVTRHMKKMLQIKNNVLRDGIWHQIPSRELVPGDIIQLSAGKIVPARCVVRLCSEELIVDCRSVLTDKNILTDISESLDQGVLQVGPEEELPAGAMVKSGEAYRVQVLNTGPNAFLHHRYHDGMVSRLRRDRRKDLVYSATRYLIVLVFIIFIIAVGAALLTAILSDRQLAQVLATASFLIVFTAVHNPVGLVLRYARTEGARRVALSKGKRLGSALHTLTTIELLASIENLAVDTRKFITSDTVSVTNVYPMKNCTASGLLIAAALATTPESQAASSPLSPEHCTPVGDMEHINMAILAEIEEHQKRRLNQTTADQEFSNPTSNTTISPPTSPSKADRSSKDHGKSKKSEPEQHKSSKSATATTNQESRRKKTRTKEDDVEIEMKDVNKEKKVEDEEKRKRRKEKQEALDPTLQEDSDKPSSKSKHGKGHHDTRHKGEGSERDKKSKKSTGKDASSADESAPLQASGKPSKDAAVSLQASGMPTKDRSLQQSNVSLQQSQLTLNASTTVRDPDNLQSGGRSPRRRRPRTGSALRTNEPISSPKSLEKEYESVGTEKETLDNIKEEEKAEKRRKKKKEEEKERRSKREKAAEDSGDVEIDMTPIQDSKSSSSRGSRKNRDREEIETCALSAASKPGSSSFVQSSSAGAQSPLSPYAQKKCMKLKGKDPCLDFMSGEASPMHMTNYIRLGALFPPGCTVVHLQALTKDAVQFARQSNPVMPPGSERVTPRLVPSRKSRLTMSSKSATSLESGGQASKPGPNLKMAGSIPRGEEDGSDEETKSVDRDCEESDPAYSTFLVAKGDPRSVIRLCIEREDKELVEKIDALVEKHCAKGKSVVAVAKGPATSMHMLERGPPNNMNLVGLLFFDGPVFDDTPACLIEAYNMGINVKMITNDSLATGTALANRIGMGSNLVTIEDYLANDPRLGGKGVDLGKADGFAEVTPENRIHLSLAAAGISDDIFVDPAQGGFRKVKRPKRPARPLWGITSTDPSVLYEADIGITHHDENDVAVQSADVVLMKPGLASLIRAIKQSRRTLNVLEGLAIACAVQSLRNIITLVAAWVTYGFQPIPTTLLTILVALNLPMLLVTAHFEKGRVTQRPPPPFLLRRITFTSFVVTLFEVLAAFLLGVIVFSVRARGITDGQAASAAFLWFGLANGFIIILCRSPCGLAFKRPLPHPAIIFIVFAMQVIASSLSIWGVGMDAIGITNGLIIWAYVLFFFAVQNMVFYASRLMWNRHLETRLHSESWFMLWHKRLSTRRWYRGLLTG